MYFIYTKSLNQLRELYYSNFVDEEQVDDTINSHQIRSAPEQSSACPLCSMILPVEIRTRHT